MSTYWAPQKNKRKGSTSTLAEQENGSQESQEPQEPQRPQEPEDAPLEQDPYYNPDLAESLGVAVVALPVEVCRDSQVPPDSLVPMQVDDGSVDQVPDPVATAPEPVPVDSVEVVDSYSPSIAPTEIEMTEPPVTASEHRVDLSQPAPVPEVSPELNKGDADDLEKVRQRIEQLRHSYHIQSRFLIKTIVVLYINLLN